MKITFSNLGAIKKTTLDLRPLTVIIGPNNSNKTYIAYSIYGLWQNVLQSPAYSIFDSKHIHRTEESFFIKINNEFIDLFVKYFKEKLDNFREGLGIFFQDSSKKLFKETRYNIEITRIEIKRAIQKFSESKIISSRNNFDYRFENNILYGDLLQNLEKNKQLGSFEMEFIFSLIWGVTGTIFSKPYPFPAERNAFILTYSVLESRRYRILRDAQRTIPKTLRDLDSELVNIDDNFLGLNYSSFPQPIEDFLDFLTDVEFDTNDEDSLNLKRKEFSNIANKIEESIQGNNKTNLKSKKHGGREIKINVKKGLDIDLYNASSSIKQLAPLLLYLRYRAQENDLLIIDEPEMNLHPESQAKLLEVLGMLVNAGVNVLLTTHSPYFMSHLNNLISGDMTDDETRETQAKSLYLEDARAFLKPEDVSAYEMRQNKAGNQTLHDLHDKDYGIRWDTLSDVSADIQQKFFEIYEKGEQSSNGKDE